MTLSDLGKLHLFLALFHHIYLQLIITSQREVSLFSTVLYY